MIIYKNGDLLSSDAQAIVNTVNCVGVMGRGIALQFKKRFPDNYHAYVAACNRNEVVPGKMFVYESESFLSPKYIINFPTKRHWRGVSIIEDIDSGLIDLAKVIKAYNIQSIAIPPLGCGLGGLHWSDVKSSIEKALEQLTDVHIEVYEPHGAPQSEKMIQHLPVSNMTPAKAALISLIRRYIEGLLEPEPSISLLGAHKLMYFLQCCGEPLKLHFVQAVHGPYAENLRHVLIAMEGFFTSGYSDGGDSPNKQISLIPGADKDAKVFLNNSPETAQRIDQVAQLVDGFESSFGLELLATVHWVLKNKSVHTIGDIINATYAWGEQKRKFSQRQIRLAYDRLIKAGF
jgi:O-acetyl-ADP-ribose deacetylase (regulator of RNase III)